MKMIRVLSFIMTLVILLNLGLTVAYAEEPLDEKSYGISLPVTNGNYTAYGEENSENRFNIIIDNVNRTGQFAIVYLDLTDYVYEYTFEIDDVIAYGLNADISTVKAYCLEHENEWKEVYLSDYVLKEEYRENDIQTFASDSNVTYFENWLINKYGSEYSGRLITTKTQNGTKMYLKSGFQVYAYKNTSYLLRNTMTVVGFVTAILGLTTGATAVAVIGAIASADGLLHMNQSVYEYKLRANWYKYATVVSGTGYPYGLTNKYTYYTAYVYTETGGRNIDTQSASTSYVPSSTAYNSNTTVFTNAFDEYSRIGYQTGSF